MGSHAHTVERTNGDELEVRMLCCRVLYVTSYHTLCVTMETKANSSHSFCSSLTKAIMGQLSSCCKPAIKDCDSVYKYHHCTPAQYSTSKVENLPDGKKERGRKEDAFKKKKKFWRRAFSHRKDGKKYISDQGSEENQGTEAAETPSDGPSARSSDDHISLQHVILTVESHDRQDLCTSNPEVLPTGHPEAEWSDNVLPTPFDWITSYHDSASDWSADVHPSPIHSGPDWSAGIFLTPVSSASDWSTDVDPTPVCSAPEWSVSNLPTPLSSPSHSSADVFHAPVHSGPNWNPDVFPASVHSVAVRSTNILQTPSPTASDILEAPVRSVSDWSVDTLETPVSTTQDSVSLENDETVATRIEAINSRRYKIGNLLGEGSFGAVFEGSRLEDGFKVAVKFVTKTENVVYISIPGHPKPLPVEVALLILANEGPRVSEIIKFLDWQDRPADYVMVLERPSPCEDLFGVAERHGGCIDEKLALIVMGQATYAALMCCQRGVLHGDIKLENLLFNHDTFEVKLIDFGCGDLLVNSPYNLFIGTDLYCPPEYMMEGKFHGKPATVWSLGVLLFALVCGDYPSDTDLDVINANLWSKSGLSKECCHLIGCLLQRNPEQRIQLGKILLHDWFKVTNVEETL